MVPVMAKNGQNLGFQPKTGVLRGKAMEHFFPEPQNLLLHPRQIMYFGSKGTLPREFFKFMVSGRLAPGFNFAIFDDFSKKHKGGPLFSKKSVEKSEKFFLEIIEERNLHLFLSGSAGVQ